MVDPKLIVAIMSGNFNQGIHIEEVLDIILNNQKLNPFNNPSLEQKKASSKKSEKEEIQIIAEKIEVLIRQRKCKQEGVCEINDEIYLETFNELIRQIAIDCPERGIVLSIIRDEIERTIKEFKNIYRNSQKFSVRREISSSNGISDLERRRFALRKKLTLLKNKKVELNNELQNLENNFEYLSIKSKSKMVEELEFHKNQNSNVEDFLSHVKQINNPLEVKANFEKNRQL